MALGDNEVQKQVIQILIFSKFPNYIFFYNIIIIIIDKTYGCLYRTRSK